MCMRLCRHWSTKSTVLDDQTRNPKSSNGAVNNAVPNSMRGNRETKNIEAGLHKAKTQTEILSFLLIA
jgi:hypothetical protein